MTDITLRPQWQEALDTDAWDRAEELWLDALDKQPIPTDELLEVRRLLYKAGQKNLALTLLELLAEALEVGGEPGAALPPLRTLVRLTDKPDGALLGRLDRAFAAAREGSPSLTDVRERHPIVGSRRPLEALEAMETWLDHDVGTIVEVQGQGVGRVVEVNLELENLKVDLGGKRPVSIPFGAIARYVQVLPEGSFLRRKVEDPEGLKKQLASDPGPSLVHILEGFAEPVDVATIKAALDGLVSTSGWSSWWTKAKKDPRVIASGSGTRLRYSVTESAEDAAQELLENLRRAEPRARLKIARDLAQRGGDAAAKAADILAEGVDDLIDADPGLAWETADVLGSFNERQAIADEVRERLAATPIPLKMLSGIAERSSRLAALEKVRQNRESDWPEIWAEWLLHEKSAPLLDEMAATLDREGPGEALDSALETVFRNHLKHPAQFVWASESMTEENAPGALVRRLRPSLLEKIPDVLSRREFSDFRSRGKGLLEGGKAAIRLILEQASQQQAERFVQRMSRLDSVDPSQLRLLEQAARQTRKTSEAEAEVVLFVATAEAIKAKREELRILLEHEIPKTLKGINAAAAEGDLRENFEYHMLRDRQELQSAQAAKLQEDLGRVRTLEPGAADTSQVNIGTVIHFEPIAGSTVDPVTILGAWDADVDRRVFANGTELAKALLGRKPGDTVTIENTEAKIAAIEAWTGR